MVWTMASQPFLLVQNPSCVGLEVSCHVFGYCSQQGFCRESSKCFSYSHWLVAAVLHLQGSERSTGNPGDNGTGDVAYDHDSDHGMKGSHELVSVPRIRPPLMCCGRPDGPAAESGAKGQQGVLNQSEPGGAIGRSFLLAMSSVRGGG